MTFAGYILGFPNDTPESIRHDLEIIKHELPLDMLEFFVLTPLPGSEDHKVLYEKGVWMDPDMNKYELEHVVTGSRQDEQGGVAGGLSLGLGHLLYRRASRDDHAARLRQRHQYPLADAGAVLVLERGEDRESASAAMGHLPRQTSQGSPLRPAARIAARRSTRNYAAEIVAQGHEARAALAASEEHRRQDRGRPATPSSIRTRR